MHNVVEPINYTRMYDIITAEIRAQGLNEPYLGGWLTGGEKRELIAQWTPNSDIKIGSIDEPFSKTHFNYPEPNFNLFAN